MPEVFNILEEIAQKSQGGNFLFRGEPEIYPTVSSSLYRQYRDVLGAGLDIQVVQSVILDAARSFADTTDEEEILTQLQHYGFPTNLIDFTLDSNTALFFACDGSPERDGRVILLPRPDESMLLRPKSPVNRTIAQKSIFVRSSSGIVMPSDTVLIPRLVKQTILEHLRRLHGITGAFLYNDLHGFIRYQNIHESANMEGLTGMARDIRGDTKGAIESYSRAIELKPDFGQTYVLRAHAQMALGRYDEALWTLIGHLT